MEVEPRQQVVDYGRPANFKCSYTGNPVDSVGWLKDGRDLGHSGDVLRIAAVKKEDRGMYQCFVRNDRESAQVKLQRGKKKIKPNVGNGIFIFRRPES